MERNALAEKLELIGQLFEIDGMNDLVNKFDKKMNQVKFNAVVIQIESLLMKDNQNVADKLIAMSTGVTAEDVEKMDDATYAQALKLAIISDVMGFFASSPRSAGKK